MDNLLGKVEAESNGYTLYSKAGDGSTATYLKNISGISLFLTCDGNGRAKLERIIGLAVCTVDWFLFPNKNFCIFENALFSLRGEWEVQKE